MTTKRGAGLKSHLGFWLRIVSQGASRGFAAKLESTSIASAEWAVLREMYEGDETTSPSAIADLTGLTRGAISKLVDRLVRKGLVTRGTDGADRRYQAIRLTPAGRALIPELGALADQNDAEFFAAISKSEAEHLRAILHKLARHHHLTTKPTH